MENIKPKRPLDNFRDLNIWLAILRNTILLILFFSYGSYPGEDILREIPGENYTFW